MAGEYQKLLDISEKLRQSALQLSEIEETKAYHPVKEDVLLHNMYLDIIEELKVLASLINKENPKEAISAARETVIKHRSRATVH